MRTLIKSLLIVALSFFASATSAETFFVNNITGSNANDGAVPENQGDRIGPLRTIAAALKQTQRGDHIELAKTDAPYEECITLEGRNNSGFELLPFIIDGNGATLDGTASVPASDWEYVRGDLYRFKPERGGHQFLFLDGEPAKQLPRSDGSYITTFLQPLEWCRCNGGIQFMSEKDKSPYSYDLRYASHRVGITLYNVENVIIRNLKVRGFQLDGINAHDNAFDCVLADISAEANGRSGISINGASRVRVVDCDATDNGEIDLRMADWSTTEVIRSDFAAETRPVWTRHTNQRGQGARLSVDGVRQTNLQGWGTPTESDEKQPAAVSKEEAEKGLLLAPDAEPTTERAAENSNDGEDLVPVAESSEASETPADDEMDLFGGDDLGGDDLGAEAEPTEDAGNDEGDIFDSFGEDDPGMDDAGDDFGGDLFDDEI